MTVTSTHDLNERNLQHLGLNYNHSAGRLGVGESPVSLRRMARPVTLQGTLPAAGEPGGRDVLDNP